MRMKKKMLRNPEGLGPTETIHGCILVGRECSRTAAESLERVSAPPLSLSSPPPSHPLSFSGAGREGCPSAGWPSVSRMTILSDGAPLQVGMRQIFYIFFTYFLLITIWPVDEKLNFHIRIFFRPKNIEIFQIFISYVY